jgi:hypothetical protein
MEWPPPGPSCSGSGEYVGHLVASLQEVAVARGRTLALSASVTAREYVQLHLPQGPLASAAGLLFDPLRDPTPRHLGVSK